MTMHITGGIDPGKTGGLVLLNRYGGGIISVHRVPYLPKKKGTTKRDIDYHALRMEWGDAIQQCEHVFIERVGGFAVHGRKQGGSGMFNFGYNAGVLRGLLEAFDTPYDLILPAKWRPIAGLISVGENVEEQKKILPSFELARKLWPESADEFKRVTVDGGVVEGALIAHAGRRILSGEVEWRSSKK